MEPDILKDAIQKVEDGASCPPVCYQVALALMLRAKSVRGAEHFVERMEAANAPVSAEAQVALARLKVTKSKPADEAPALPDDGVDDENISIPEQAARLAEFILTMISRRRCVRSTCTVVVRVRKEGEQQKGNAPCADEET